jgi:eukaryotic-like serine/threonine-protein kinase
LHIFAAFGAAWVIAAFALRGITRRQRALTFASVPAMVFLSIHQTPDRALASFPYAVLIPAGIFVAQLPEWLVAALLAANLAFTIEMNTMHGPDARVWMRVGLLLALAAATAATIRARPKTPEGNGARPSPLTQSLDWIESVFVVAGVCGLLIVGGPLIRGLIMQQSATMAADLPPDPDARPVDDGTGAPGIAVSPDGRRIIFVGLGSDGERRLFLYDLRSRAVTAVPESAGGSAPFWAPDGRHIGFFAHGHLQTADLYTHRVRVLADAPSGRGGTWSSRGVIVFAASLSGGLVQVAESGIGPKPATRAEATSTAVSHRWPSFLPDGDHFLFVMQGGNSDEGVYVGSLSSSRIERLSVRSTASATYVDRGLLITSLQDHLVAYSFDARRRQLFSRPMNVADGILRPVGTGLTPFAASSDTLVYAPTNVIDPEADHNVKSQLQRIDRSGRLVSALGDIGNINDIQLSPDRRWIAETVQTTDGQQYGITEIRRRARERDGWSRFVSAPDRSELTPLWSADGRRIAFAIQPRIYHTWYLVEQASTGAPPERRLLSHPDRPVRPTSWSPDGKFLIYQIWTEEHWGVWSVSTRERAELSPILRGRFNATQAQLSPNGELLAYSSDESGQREVYVEPFPRSGPRWRISVEGGSQPRWRADSREIIYVARDAVVTAVPIDTVPTFRAGMPHVVFEVPLVPDRRCAFCYQYAMTPDAQEFVVNRLAKPQPMARVTVISNWRPGVPPA